MSLKRFFIASIVLVFLSIIAVASSPIKSEPVFNYESQISNLNIASYDVALDVEVMNVTYRPCDIVFEVQALDAVYSLPGIVSESKISNIVYRAVYGSYMHIGKMLKITYSKCLVKSKILNLQIGNIYRNETGKDILQTDFCNIGYEFEPSFNGNGGIEFKIVNNERVNKNCDYYKSYYPALDILLYMKC